MKTENELKELSVISDAADYARDVARKDYNAARDALIGSPDYYNYEATADERNTYNAACDVASKAWDVYISEEEKTNKEINKMKTENKMNELKIDAWDTQNAEIEAAAARDAAWAIYIDASEALTAAHDAAQRAANAANDFEAGDYEALDYEAED